MWQILAALALAPADPPAQETIMLRAPGEPALCVHHQQGAGRSVLYIHGSTFPAALSVGYRLDGRSWADDLNARGFDVWSFDFAGYGCSDRPAVMQLKAVARETVPGRARDAARQIARVVHYIGAQSSDARVSIIAHSWGTIPAGLFAGSHPDLVSRLVLFGPVAQRRVGRSDKGATAPSRLVSAADQWASFQSGVPHGEQSPIASDRFNAWADAYLESDPTSAERVPRSNRVPAGPDADFADAYAGHLPYDPRLIRAPTLIVRGEWDAIATDSDVAWLKAALTHVPGGAVDEKLARGAHRMHLEQNRQALFDAVGRFLAARAQ